MNDRIKEIRARTEYNASRRSDDFGHDTQELLIFESVALQTAAYDIEFLLGEIERLERIQHEFKNFHRNLCKRFNYTHDERDWKRDQLSLEEHIAADRDEIIRMIGSQDEAARRAKVDEAVARLIEALEFRRMHDDDCADATEKFAPNEMCECGASLAKDALAALRAEIERMK